MSARIFETNSSQPVLTLRHPTDWVAVVCFGGLGALHLGLASTMLTAGGWESQLSAVFGGIFACVALLCLLVSREIIIYGDRKQIGVCRSLGSLVYERNISFSDVESVRVVLAGLGRRHECAGTIVTRQGEIELPPSPTPRQVALALALLMKVRFVKIYTEAVPEPSRRIDQLFGQTNPDVN